MANSLPALEMPTRRLGHTGVQVSAIGLGGSHIGKPKLASKDAIRIMRMAIDSGLTFMDNCWDYNEGESELRMGKALKDGYRQKAFVMSKVDGRTKKEATRQLNQSLKRLGVECIDLLQHHEIIRFDDPDRIFAEDGAMAAFLEARQAGKIRYIGFTGHKDPHVHLYMLIKAREHGFRFDTVQMPLNLMDAHYRSFQVQVLPALQAQDIGVLGMKSLAGGIILKSQTVTAVECLRYSLSLPTSVVITGIDSVKVLRQALEVAGKFEPMTSEETSGLLQKTKSAALAGKYEVFKTSTHFDSTIEHPEWLGEESREVKAVAGR